MLALLLIAASPTLDASSASLLTSVVATGAAVDARVDVIASEDVKRAIDVEAEKRLLGCDAQSQSCLAELASAMGAGLILVTHGGLLGDTLTFSIDLFDSEHATSGGRGLVRAASLDELSRSLESETHRLVADYLTQHPSKARLKVLVLDAHLDAPAATAPVVASSGTPWLAIVGVSVATIGVVGLGIGGAFDLAGYGAHEAAKSASTQLAAVDDVRKWHDNGSTAVVFYLGGGVGAVLGGALAGVGFAVSP